MRELTIDLVSEESKRGLAEAEPGVVFIPAEEAICLCCTSSIPRENIKASLLPQAGFTPVTQHINAYCEHCDTHYELDRQLRGGIWQAVGAVAVIPGRKRKPRTPRRVA